MKIGSAKRHLALTLLVPGENDFRRQLVNRFTFGRAPERMQRAASGARGDWPQFSRRQARVQITCDLSVHLPSEKQPRLAFPFERALRRLRFVFGFEAFP